MPRPASTGADPRTPVKNKRLSQLQEIIKQQSTPIRVSTSGAICLPHLKPRLNPILAMEVDERSNYVSVDTWMSALSRFTQATLATWTSAIKTLGYFEDPVISTALTDFCRSGELDRYVPLSQILNQLLVKSREDSASFVDLPPAMDVCDLVYFRHDPKYLLGPTEQGDLVADRKPDVISAREAQRKRRVNKERVPWNQAIMCFELKHTRKVTDLLEKRRTGATAAEGMVETSTEPREAAAAPAEASGSTSRRGSESRKRGSSTQDEVVQPPRKKSKSQQDIETKESEGQMASYALEMAASTYGTRLHNIGIFMRDDKITLWYFDAAGVVRTKSEPALSIIDDFEKVAAIFIALSYSTPEQFGAFPRDIIRPPENARYPGAFPAATLDGYTIDLSPTVQTAPDGAAHDGAAPDGAGPLTTAPGDDTKQVVVTLGNPLFQQYVLFGRRTTVYSARISNDAHQGKLLVVKLSQQAATRESEVTLIARAEKYGVKNIPKIHYYKDIYKLSDGIRNLFVYDEAEELYEDRVLRCIVTDRYKPLCEQLAKNPDSIKTMVRQMLKCIRDLRYDAHILHRDVSDSNIMWTEKDGKDWFILNDFDLAVMVDESGKPLGPTSRHRTGTLPFMSPELLHDMHAASLRPKEKRDESVNSVIHCVRMDYESTALVAVWFAIKTTEDGASKKAYEDYLKEWESGTYKSMAQAKEGFLHKAKNAATLPLSPLFAHLSSWFKALLAPFCNGAVKQALEEQAALERQEEYEAVLRRARLGKGKNRPKETPQPPAEPSHHDLETMYGEVTFEAFLNRLNAYEAEQDPPESELTDSELGDGEAGGDWAEEGGLVVDELQGAIF